MYKKIIITVATLIANYANAQQIINPNIKHDWEDIRYTVNGNNTVSDNKTNLIWKKCSQGLTGSGCTTDVATAHNWQDALDLADSSTFAGFTDWRLPNTKELRSIAAYDRYNPAINSAIFPNTPNSYFWSSSPYVSVSSGAWILDFHYGFDSGNDRHLVNYVRLVRGGQ